MNGPSSVEGPVARTTATPSSAVVPARGAARWMVDGCVAGPARNGPILSVPAATAAGYLVERARHPLAAVHALRGGTGDMEVAL